MKNKKSTRLFVIAMITIFLFALLYILSPIKFSFKPHSDLLCGAKGYKGYAFGPRHIACCSGEYEPCLDVCLGNFYTCK